MATPKVALNGDGAKLTLEFPKVVPRKARNEPYLWLDLAVRGRAGGSSFHGSASVTAGEVHAFHTELEEVVQALDGTARFHPMEGALEISVTVAGTGYAEVAVAIKEHLQAEVQVRWVFGTDQTYLSQTVRDLARICERLPEED